MKCLVTGGAGFIGSNLVDRLIGDGHSVIVIDNLSTGRRSNVNPAAKFYKLDIEKNHHQLFRGVDWVFHLAARPRIQFAAKFPVEADIANVHGTVQVLAAAVRHKVKRFIYSSSSSVYGRYPWMANEESSIPKPVNLYGYQKWAAEQYCWMFRDLYGLSVIALRYFNVYGPRMTSDGYGTVIGKFLEAKRLKKAMIIDGDGEQRRDFTHVSDVVEANILAAQSSLEMPLNIGSGDPASINQVAAAIGGKKRHIKDRPGDVRQTFADNGFAREFLNWRPQVTLAQGLTDLKKSWNIINN